MKFFGVLSTVLVASSLVGSLGYSEPTVPYQPNLQMTLQEAQQQIGAQKRIIYRESQALKIARQNRDNSVHLTKDFFLEVGAAAGAGFFFTRAWRNTNGFAKIRSYFPSKDVASKAELDAVDLEKTAEKGTTKWLTGREIGTITLRATEVASGAILTGIFIEDLVPTLNEFVVGYKDTDDMKAAQQRIDEAQRQLDVADQRLQEGAIAEATGAQGM